MIQQNFLSRASKALSLSDKLMQNSVLASAKVVSDSLSKISFLIQAMLTFWKKIPVSVNESTFASDLVGRIMSSQVLHYSVLINCMFYLDKLSWRDLLITGPHAPFNISSFWQTKVNRDVPRRMASNYFSVLQSSLVRNSGMLHSRQWMTVPLFIVKAGLINLNAATILVLLWSCSNWFYGR